MSDVQTRVGLGFDSSGASAVASDIGSIYRALRDGESTVKQANQALHQYTGSIYAQRRAIMMIRTEWRNNNAALLESMRGMMAAARIGRTLTNVYQTYTLMQIRSADAQRDIRNTEEDLLRIQGLRERAVRDLGAGSVYAIDLLEQERKITERLNEEKQDLVRAQRENIVGYTGMGLSMIGVLASSVDLYYHMKITKAILGGTWEMTALGKLGTALAARYAEAVALQNAIAAIPTALTAAINAVTLGGAAAIVATTADVLLNKTPDEQAELAYQLAESGAFGLGPDWGRTQEGMESDLPAGSGLRDLYTGESPMSEDLLNVVKANRQYGSDYDEYEQRKSSGGITLHQTNVIRTADDKTTVDKIADATVRMVGDRVMR